MHISHFIKQCLSQDRSWINSQNLEDARAGYTLQKNYLKKYIFEIKVLKLLVKAFNKYIASHGLRTLCNGPETPTQWTWKSESVVMDGPMHYEAIHSISKFKSKALVFAQFWFKSDESSSHWWTTVQILEETYLHHIFAKKCGIQKNLFLVSVKLQSLTGPASLRKWSLKYTNISWYLLIVEKYFICSFEACVQPVSKHSFTPFLQPAAIATDSIANPPSAVDRIQLVPKGETGQRIISRYFV